MRVAFLSQPWDEIVTPIERGSASVAIITYRLAAHLARSHEVEIYARRGLGQPATEKTREGIVIHRVPATARRLHQLLDRVSGIVAPSRPFFASKLHSLAYWLQLARALERRRPDVIHVFTFAQHVPLLRRHNPYAKIVLHMQGESLAQLDHDVIARQLADVDRMIGCSDFITEQVRRRFPDLADRCATVYNGADVDHFRGAAATNGTDPSNHPRILFVARVSPEKGVHVLLDAFARVLERHPDARLDIVGAAGSMIALPYSYHVGISRDPLVRDLGRFYGGSVVDKIRRQLLPGGPSYLGDLQRRLSPAVAERVAFRGQLPHADLLGLYRSTDVFVFPSVWEEPFGMPIVEAMACRLPVVATRGGGISEIVENRRTGLLVERGDADGLAAAIVELLGDENMRRELGESGRRRAEALFGWSKVGETLAKVYEGLERDVR